MNERDGDPTGALAPQSPPLIKGQTKLTVLFVLMAISGGILAQLSYQQFLPEKTCDDPTTAMERIGISLFVISTFFVASTSSSCFGLCSTVDMHFLHFGTVDSCRP